MQGTNTSILILLRSHGQKRTHPNGNTWARVDKLIGQNTCTHQNGAGHLNMIQVKRNNMIKCRCCNKQVFNIDKYLDDWGRELKIHTKCIKFHWSNHSKGISNSRCFEFKNTGDQNME